MEPCKGMYIISDSSNRTDRPLTHLHTPGRELSISEELRGAWKCGKTLSITTQILGRSLANFYRQ